MNDLFSKTRMISAPFSRSVAAENELGKEPGGGGGAGAGGGGGK